MWKRIGFALLGIVIIFVIVTLVKTFIVTSKQPEAQTVTTSVDEATAIKHLSKAVTFETVSQDERSKIDYEAFEQFLTFLENTYPAVYKELDVKRINDYSLLMKWQGEDSEKAIGLMGHYDVVPVAKGTEKNWTEPAFSGATDETYIWGRGTLDDKVGVIGILEAVNNLLKEGKKPAHDVYLLFGHDEEIGGDEGAAKIVDYLKAQGVHLSYVLDEGGVIVRDMVPGVDQSIGVIGIAEKGSATATLTVEGSGGHSSQPKNITTLGRLSRAIAKLEETQFDSDIQGPTKQMFDYVTPEMNVGYRYIFANQWLFKPVIKNILLGKSATAAVTRTTIAPTVLNAGDKENILPEKATATVNLRVMPGDTLASLKQQMTEIIDDKAVTIELTGDEASKVSDTNNAAFKQIQQAIVSTHEETIAVPYIMIGASDAKHYGEVADNTYRFLPLAMEEDGLERMHGTNERVAKKAFIQAIAFYENLLSR